MGNPLHVPMFFCREALVFLLHPQWCNLQNTLTRTSCWDGSQIVLGYWGKDFYLPGHIIDSPGVETREGANTLPNRIGITTGHPWNTHESSLRCALLDLLQELQASWEKGRFKLRRSNRGFGSWGKSTKNMNGWEGDSVSPGCPLSDPALGPEAYSDTGSLIQIILDLQP